MVTEKIRLKIREDIQTTSIEVTTSYSNVADEEHFFFTQTDNEFESEKKRFNGQNNLGKTQWNA